MKKYFALVLMAVAFAMPSKAQIKFGVQAGLNMSNVSTATEIAGGKADAVKSRTGFFIGPTVKFTLPVVGLGIDAAALYDQREGKADNEVLKSSSIQIPINLRYGVGLGSLAEIFAFAGPQFGFKLSGNKSVKDEFGEVADWRLKTSNLSANFGIGATILSKLQAKLNYNVALGKTGEVEATFDGVRQAVGSAKFNAWQVSLAYFF
ncbi:Outer membrane protein beta-barrel domain-containing protein [Prevotellaceae bacterium HUN156]|nr:Outer membrane protein beta-barrel domain-containing protein [Prevotellaceae bacterium HUN156]